MYFNENIFNNISHFNFEIKSFLNERNKFFLPKPLSKMVLNCRLRL